MKSVLFLDKTVLKDFILTPLPTQIPIKDTYEPKQTDDDF